LPIGIPFTPRLLCVYQDGRPPITFVALIFLATLHASSQFLALLALFSALKSVIGRRPGCFVRLIYLNGAKKAVDTKF
jgi:hypothetical protein